MSTRLTDLSTLDRLFKGDRTRMADWLRLYLEESPALFGALAQRLEAGDTKALGEIAHELRPQAHYLGAPRLLEALIALGERAHSGDATACREHVHELIALGQSVEDEVMEMLDKT
jgi:HPt (histidine-containing phosphotransfer) domain-containing protein